MNFEFSTISNIHVEWGAAKRIGSLLRQRYPQQKRLCLITDSFLHSSGLLTDALANLKDSQWEVLVIDDVIADPTEAIVLQVLDKAKEAGSDLVLGFGGGSSMDVAKLIAVLLSSDQSLTEMYGIGNITHQKSIPLVQIPTTAGTGSEVTPISVVTTGTTTKSGILDPALYANLAILDAELTIGLPAAITAATGIDAMVHAVESYTNNRTKNPLSDMLAIKAISLLAANIVLACEDGANRQAREAMLLGAMLAGQAFANSPVAAVHALAYPLGGVFHVPHGLSNSLVLPHVMRFNISHVSEHYAELADAVLPGCSGSDEEKSLQLINFFEQVAERTGIARTLREVGVSESDLEQLATDAMLQTRLLDNNPRQVTYEDALQIYQAAF